jgi:hypothetical protein
MNDNRLRPWVRGGLVGGASVFVGGGVFSQRGLALGGIALYFLAIHVLVVMNWARMSGYDDARMPLLILWVFVAEIITVAAGVLAVVAGAPWQVGVAAILAVSGMPLIVLGSIDVIDWWRRR